MNQFARLCANLNSSMVTSTGSTQSPPVHSHTKGTRSPELTSQRRWLWAPHKDTFFRNGVAGNGRAVGMANKGCEVVGTRRAAGLFHRSMWDGFRPVSTVDNSDKADVLGFDRQDSEVR